MTRRGLARREQLLDAASKIATEEGLGALTVARLASDLGVAVGGLYRHFASKDALLGALQARAVASFGEDVRARLAAFEARHAGVAEPIRALAAALTVMTAYLEDATQAPARHRLIDAFLSSLSPVLADPAARALEASVADVLAVGAGQLERAAKAGAISSGDQLQRTVGAWALLHGLDHFRKRDRLVAPSLQTRALLEAMLRDLFTAWGASRQAFDAAWTLAGGPSTPEGGAR